MTVHLMVNWRDEEIMTRKQYEEEKIPATVDSWENDSDVFAEWLANRYYPYEIWNMSNDERDSVREKFVHYCREKALDELIDNGWEDFWVEI